jgi:hypothetical protein
MPKTSLIKQTLRQSLTSAKAWLGFAVLVTLCTSYPSVYAVFDKDGKEIEEKQIALKNQKPKKRTFNEIQENADQNPSSNLTTNTATSSEDQNIKKRKITPVSINPRKSSTYDPSETIELTDKKPFVSIDKNTLNYLQPSLCNKIGKVPSFSPICSLENSQKHPKRPLLTDINVFFDDSCKTFRDKNSAPQLIFKYGTFKFESNKDFLTHIKNQLRTQLSKPSKRTFKGSSQQLLDFSKKQSCSLKLLKEITLVDFLGYYAKEMQDAIAVIADNCCSLEKFGLHDCASEDDCERLNDMDLCYMGIDDLLEEIEKNLKRIFKQNTGLKSFFIASEGELDEDIDVPPDIIIDCLSSRKDSLEELSVDNMDLARDDFIKFFSTFPKLHTFKAKNTQLDDLDSDSLQSINASLKTLRIGLRISMPDFDVEQWTKQFQNLTNLTNLSLDDIHATKIVATLFNASKNLQKLRVCFTGGLDSPEDKILLLPNNRMEKLSLNALFTDIRDSQFFAERDSQFFSDLINACSQNLKKLTISGSLCAIEICQAIENCLHLEYLKINKCTFSKEAIQKWGKKCEQKITGNSEKLERTYPLLSLTKLFNFLPSLKTFVCFGEYTINRRDCTRSLAGKLYCEKALFYAPKNTLTEIRFCKSALHYAPKNTAKWSLSQCHPAIFTGNQTTDLILRHKETIVDIDAHDLLDWPDTEELKMIIQECTALKRLTVPTRSLLYTNIGLILSVLLEQNPELLIQEGLVRTYCILDKAIIKVDLTNKGLIGVHFTEPGPFFWHELFSINLQSSTFSEIELIEIVKEHCKTLQYIDLSNTAISLKGLSTITKNCPYLKFINVENCPSCKAPECVRQFFKDCPGLLMLRISNGSITWSILRYSKANNDLLNNTLRLEWHSIPRQVLDSDPPLPDSCCICGNSTCTEYQRNFYSVSKKLSNFAVLGIYPLNKVSQLQDTTNNQNQNLNPQTSNTNHLLPLLQEESESNNNQQTTNTPFQNANFENKK